MFTKFLLVITLVGATACILLVNRQQRIETANEIAQIHRRLLEYDQAMWAMRNEIASRCTPDFGLAAGDSPVHCGAQITPSYGSKQWRTC